MYQRGAGANMSTGCGGGCHSSTSGEQTLGADRRERASPEPENAAAAGGAGAAVAPMAGGDDGTGGAPGRHHGARRRAGGQAQPQPGVGGARGFNYFKMLVRNPVPS